MLFQQAPRLLQHGILIQAMDIGLHEVRYVRGREIQAAFAEAFGAPSFELRDATLQHPFALLEAFTIRILGARFLRLLGQVHQAGRLPELGVLVRFQQV